VLDFSAQGFDIYIGAIIRP